MFIHLYRLCVFLICLESVAALMAQEISPDALRAVEAYGASLDVLKNFQGTFETHNGLLPHITKLFKPGRLGVKPLSKFKNQTFEICDRGAFCFTTGLKMERYDYEASTFERDSKSVMWMKRILAYDGKQVFAYEVDQNSGSVYLQDGAGNNALVTLGGLGALLGKRAHDRPAEDLLDFMRRCKTLKVDMESAEEVTVSGVTSAITNNVETDLSFKATLLKECGFMPRYWEVGIAQYGLRIRSVENYEFFQVSSMWLPKQGVLNYYQTLIEGDGYKDSLLYNSWVVIDPKSIKVNQALPPDYFSPKTPEGGVVYNKTTGEYVKSTGEIIVGPKPSARVDNSPSKWPVYALASASAVIGVLVAWFFLRRS